jgi:hypothetical protein
MADPVRVVQSNQRLPATVASSNAPCSGRHRLALRTPCDVGDAQRFEVAVGIQTGQWVFALRPYPTRLPGASTSPPPFRARRGTSGQGQGEPPCALWCELSEDGGETGAAGRSFIQCDVDGQQHRNPRRATFSGGCAKSSPRWLRPIGPTSTGCGVLYRHQRADAPAAAPPRGADLRRRPRASAQTDGGADAGQFGGQDRRRAPEKPKRFHGTVTLDPTKCKSPHCPLIRPSPAD